MTPELSHENTKDTKRTDGRFERPETNRQDANSQTKSEARG
jgi:hypothetical protein